MKFLCLHGAIGNASNFSIQLDTSYGCTEQSMGSVRGSVFLFPTLMVSTFLHMVPGTGPLFAGAQLTHQTDAVERELAGDGTATFQFVDAPCKVNPPQGFENYFGIGPHWRWFDDGGLAQTSMLTRIRVLPTGDSPEDIMRGLRQTEDRSSVINPASDGHWPNRIPLLKYLYDTLEANRDIQGVVGYSEGACIAASLVLDEMKRAEVEGRPRQIKCGMFITGWPPISPDEKAVLSDESPLRLDIPTLHLVGANDPYKCGALALFNTCDDDKAILFDTGKGHTIPRAGPVIKELGDSIREMMDMAGCQR